MPRPEEPARKASWAPCGRQCLRFLQQLTLSSAFILAQCEAAADLGGGGGVQPEPLASAPRHLFTCTPARASVWVQGSTQALPLKNRGERLAELAGCLFSLLYPLSTRNNLRAQSLFPVLERRCLPPGWLDTPCPPAWSSIGASIAQPWLLCPLRGVGHTWRTGACHALRAP